MNGRIVLASKSPRRLELLRNAGFTVEVRIADVEEIPAAGELPIAYVRRLAQSKAAAVVASEQELVLAADTIVVVDDKILEKPADPADAIRMLSLLSGRQHTVHTGICVRYGGQSQVDHAQTTVEFACMTPDEIAAYVSTGEPMDKAGAYGIQGYASRFVTSIDGCYFNIVGLPVSLVYRHMSDILKSCPVR
ncbi:Maf-like protein [Bryobacterales bacterium F-183]|nr:Maf-like protein [Bryobacterales bacterium F-183]